MKKQNKLELIGKAYTTMQKGDKTIHIMNAEVLRDVDEDIESTIRDIQINLDADFELSFDIMADACDIIAEKTLDGNDREALNHDDCDFFADADSSANVYISVQLSYLNMKNEDEISALMKDEAITSIAQACSIWYSQKVAEACEALRAYIIL